ncbi:MAG: GxxExxY protein [Candidatus Hydrogenedentes bacterium]|nr:GxxExxY protein [Candidatus Hydrogenedentota bacterium]
MIERVLGAAIAAHAELGPGLFETIYEHALLIELEERGVSAKNQVPINVVYKGRDLGIGFKADIIVDGQLLLELKAVEELNDIHMAQVITYLKLLGIKRGFLLNLNEKLLKDGVKRISI